jgi:hypothetical protein
MGHGEKKVDSRQFTVESNNKTGNGEEFNTEDTESTEGAEKKTEPRSRITLRRRGRGEIAEKTDARLELGGRNFDGDFAGEDRAADAAC